MIAGPPDPNSPGKALVASGIALGVCLALGLWNGLLVSVLGIQPIIATLMLMTAGRGLAMLITDGQITTVNNDLFKEDRQGVRGRDAGGGDHRLAVFAMTAVLTRRTALGMLVEAVGINPEASRLAGVRAPHIIWTAYVFSGLCAGLAGLMIASNTHAADANNAGLWIELDAILAVVIGGTSLAGGRFSLAGTLVGVLLTTSLRRSGEHRDPLETNYLFKAVVVIAVCLLQSPARRALSVRRRRPGSSPRSPHERRHAETLAGSSYAGARS